MKTILLTALLLCFAAMPALAQQFDCYGTGCPGSGGTGTGVPNVTATCAGTSSSCSVDVHTLNLASWDPALAQCWYYTTASPSTITPMTLLPSTITGTSPITAVSLNYASPSSSSLSVGCKVSSNGGAGPAGATGAAGQSVAATVESAGVNCATGGVKLVSASGTNYACNGANGSNGSNGTNGTNGSNGVSVTVTAESAGANCTYGGEKLVSASGTSYVCNGGGGGGATYINPSTEISVTGDGSSGTPYVLSADFSVLPGLPNTNVWSNLNDFSLGQIRVEVGSGIPSPSSCSASGNVGKVYMRNDAAAINASHYVCSQTGSGSYGWELTQASGGSLAGTLIKHMPMATYSIGALAYSCAPDQLNSTYLTIYTVLTCGSSNFGGTAPYYQFAFFPNSGTPGIELRAGYIPMTGWTGNLTLRTRATADAGGTGTGSFKVATACVGDGDAVVPTYNTDQMLSLAITSGSYKFGSLALTTTGCAAGSAILLRIVRDPTVGGSYTGNVLIPDMEIYQ